MAQATWLDANGKVIARTTTRVDLVVSFGRYVGIASQPDRYGTFCLQNPHAC